MCTRGCVPTDGTSRSAWSKSASAGQWPYRLSPRRLIIACKRREDRLDWSVVLGHVIGQGSCRRLDSVSTSTKSSRGSSPAQRETIAAGIEASHLSHVKSYQVLISSNKFAYLIN